MGSLAVTTRAAQLYGGAGWAPTGVWLPAGTIVDVSSISMPRPGSGYWASASTPHGSGFISWRDLAWWYPPAVTHHYVAPPHVATAYATDAGPRRTEIVPPAPITSYARPYVRRFPW
jgi:hypothetical protein